MPRLTWSDSSQAVALPRVRVERFNGKSRYRVHLLGEVRCLRVHKRAGENTMPCLAPDPCPFCADPIWKPKLEWFGPALLMDKKENLWVPVVAVFTSGGGNKLRKCAPGPHRGRMLDVYRVGQGTAQGGILEVKELVRVDPLVPEFDVLPHLHRLWFPNEAVPVEAEVPAAVPFTPEQAPSIAEAKAEPFRVSEDVKKALHRYAKTGQRDEEPAPAAPEPPPPAAPAPVPTGFVQVPPPP
ncbi:hypothetical protein R5W23_003646, partial [Gemmata sp. JC673]